MDGGLTLADNLFKSLGKKWGLLMLLELIAWWLRYIKTVLSFNLCFITLFVWKFEICFDLDHLRIQWLFGMKVDFGPSVVVGATKPEVKVMDL